MNPVEKQNVMTRLRRASLWNDADSFREEARLRRRANGEDRASATSASWREMWAVYEPIVERLEARDKAERVEPQLSGLPADLDSVLDPDYSETDRGRQLRDGLLWAALEWSRVIEDTGDGPVADLAAASTPPPNSWAITVLCTYALGSLDKRRELIARAMAFATKGRDTTPETEEEEDDGGYLNTIA